MQVQFLAKPMTFKERCYARKHRTFLVRNVDKVRNQKHPGQEFMPITKEELNILDSTKMSSYNPGIYALHLFMTYNTNLFLLSGGQIATR